MAHQLDTQDDGRIAMAYVEGSEAPWHSDETNPQIVKKGSSIETWAKESGTDYKVEIAPNQRNGVDIPDSYHIARTDRNEVIGPYIAGQYIPVQNSVAYELAENICHNFGYEISTAGALFGGSSMWIQLDTPLVEDIKGGDTITSKPTININHSGTDANRFLTTNVRVVCNNTLTMAMQGSDEVIKHDHRVPFDMEAVKTALGYNAKAFGEYAKIARKMAERALSNQEALEFFRMVMGGKEKEKDGVIVWSQGVRKAMAYYKGEEFIAEGKKANAEIIEAVNAELSRIAKIPNDVTKPAPVNAGFDMDSANGTLWGAFNTVTWLADQRPVKNRGLEHQIASHALGDGTGGKLKQKAQRVALELLAA